MNGRSASNEALWAAPFQAAFFQLQGCNSSRRQAHKNATLEASGPSRKQAFKTVEGEEMDFQLAGPLGPPG
jgi:hypothetical protein